jgi:hypothetical protein
MPVAAIRRREFISLLGGTAIVPPKHGALKLPNFIAV